MTLAFLVCFLVLSAERYFLIVERWLGGMTLVEFVVIMAWFASGLGLLISLAFDLFFKR